MIGAREGVDQWMAFRGVLRDQPGAEIRVAHGGDLFRKRQMGDFLIGRSTHARIRLEIVLDQSEAQGPAGDACQVAHELKLFVYVAKVAYPLQYAGCLYPSAALPALR